MLCYQVISSFTFRAFQKQKSSMCKTQRQKNLAAVFLYLKTEVVRVYETIIPTCCYCFAKYLPMARGLFPPLK